MLFFWLGDDSSDVEENLLLLSLVVVDVHPSFIHTYHSTQEAAQAMLIVHW